MLFKKKKKATKKCENMNLWHSEPKGLVVTEAAARPPRGAGHPCTARDTTMGSMEKPQTRGGIVLEIKLHGVLMCLLLC